MVIISNRTVQKAFSGSAEKYDLLAGLQEKIGQRLVAEVQNKKDCKQILDVGMGTGRMTNALSHLYPKANVCGLDFAEGMVKFANKLYSNFSVIQADAEVLPFKTDIFDIVVSNSAYQWVNNLEEAFRMAFLSLKKQGIFCAALFGRNSLNELFESVEKSYVLRSRNGKIVIRKLPEKNEICEAVEMAGFSNINVSTSVEKVYFSDMLGLLRWLKGIGANATRRSGYIGKENLLKANDYYKKHFKDTQGIFASFEVIFVKAKKIN